jgi:hypothetical protein
VTQEQVRDWWNCNPMSYDVGSPIVAVPASRGYFRELDRRVLAQPLAQRIGLHFDGARTDEEAVSVQPYGQDAELLPLPRKIRVPITDRLPRGLRDAVLDRLGQLAATAAKPA